MGPTCDEVAKEVESEVEPMECGDVGGEVAISGDRVVTWRMTW